MLIKQKISLSLPKNLVLATFCNFLPLGLHNIHVTPKLVEKVLTNHHLSKLSGPDCISVVVLKKCESELSEILEFMNHSIHF